MNLIDKKSHCIPLYSALKVQFSSNNNEFLNSELNSGIEMTAEFVPGIKLPNGLTY